MKINCPYVTQADVDEAIETIGECYFTNPVHGLKKPFYAPGGYYGNDCWNLDYTLIIDFVKWYLPERVYGYVENIAAMQDESGRIKLYGSEYFGHVPNIKEPVSSAPKRLRTLPQIARMYPDKKLAERALTVAVRDFEWWIKHRLDEKTGLFSAVFEETFIPNRETGSYCYAPLDTNIELWLACRELADLIPQKADCFKDIENKLKAAINRYLWDEDAGCYLPYDLKAGRRINTYPASTFLGFYVADGEKKQKLYSLLTDTESFGWNTLPLYSVSEKSPLFQVVEGKYNGNPAWSGSVWTYLNHQTVSALRFAGLDTAATTLTKKTLEEFRGNYAEFLHPFSGEGHGVLKYGWSAAQWLQLLTEDLFGISYTAGKGLCVTPHLSPELLTEDMSIEGLALPDGTTADVFISKGTVKTEIH